MPPFKRRGSGLSNMRNRRERTHGVEKLGVDTQDYGCIFDASSKPLTRLGWEMLMMLMMMGDHRHFALTGTGVFG